MEERITRALISMTTTTKKKIREIKRNSKMRNMDQVVQLCVETTHKSLKLKK